jgi:hypothetical protein
MSLMGQGIADAYARAGEIEGKGYMALGQGIAQGLTAAGGAIGDYKKMSSQVKADAAAFNSFKDYLPAKFVGLQQAMENDPSASLLDKQQFYQSAKGYLGAAIGQQYKMEQIGAEQKGLFDRAVAGKKPVPDLSGIASGLKQATGTPSQSEPVAPTPSGSPFDMPGDDFDLNSAVDKLEVYMINEYGPDYKARKIQPSERDMVKAGFRTR